MHLWYYNRSVEQLGKRYTLISLLGSGGMAEVYLAWDERDRHEVAIKIIRPNVFDPRVPKRFSREGNLVAALDHPFIIHIYGDGVQQETFTNPDPTSSDILTVPYIVMEYVKGDDLKKRLEAGEVLTLDEIEHIFEQLCIAVQYAHDRGVIHRDIKPANILFRKHPLKGNQVVLGDFGLALLTDDTHYSFPEAGTPQYMAPEQWLGKPKPASDIFSLGVVLYQLCTGHLPFQESELAFPLQQPKRPNEHNNSLPPALDDVILRALSNDPSERFASASLFWQEIQSVMREPPIPPISPAISARNRPSNGAQPTTSLPGVQPSVPLLSVTEPNIAGIANLSPNTENDNDSNGPPSAPGESISSNLPGKQAIIVLPMPNGNAGDIVAGKAGAPTSVLVPEVPTSAAEISRTRPPVRKLSDRNRRVIIVALVIMTLLVIGAGVVRVSVHQLNSTKTDTKQVPLAHFHQDAKPATGKITFFNGSFNTLIVLSGTTFLVSDVQIVTDEIAMVPAATLGPPMQAGQKTVAAHAVQPGTAGNIAALAINQVCCGSSSITADNQNAFTGGTDTAEYNYLKPEDVTKIINDNQSILKSKAHNDIKEQIKTVDHLLGDTSCDPPKTTEDVQPNVPQANTITTAHVTVSVSCKVEVFAPMSFIQ